MMYLHTFLIQALTNNVVYFTKRAGDTQDVFKSRRSLIFNLKCVFISVGEESCYTGCPG